MVRKHSVKLLWLLLLLLSSRSLATDWTADIGGGANHYAVLPLWGAAIATSNSAAQHARCWATGSSLGDCTPLTLGTPTQTAYVRIYPADGQSHNWVTNSGAAAGIIHFNADFSRLDDMRAESLEVLSRSNSVSRCILTPTSAGSGIYVEDAAFSGLILPLEVSDTIILRGKQSVYLEAESSMLQTGITLTLQNCTFYEPSSQVLEWYNDSATMTIDARNCMFIAASASGGENYGTINATASYNVDSGATLEPQVRALGGTVTHTLSNQTVSVLFQSPPSDLRLRYGSPAINAGTNTATSATDCQRKGRRAYGRQDIGAFERQFQNPVQ